MKTLCFCKYISANINDISQTQTYLFVANGEFTLCLLVVIDKVLQLLDCIIGSDSSAELDIGLGILVTRL